MATVLADKTCTPCRGGVPPLTPKEAEGYLVQAPDWSLMDDATRIERRFRFKDFGEAFAFVTRAAELAEAEGHHPDITFGWGYDGLAQNEKDQGPARKRLHHGCEARPHRRRPRGSGAASGLRVSRRVRHCSCRRALLAGSRANRPFPHPELGYDTLRSRILRPAAGAEPV